MTWIESHSTMWVRWSRKSAVSFLGWVYLAKQYDREILLCFVFCIIHLETWDVTSHSKTQGWFFLSNWSKRLEYAKVLLSIFLNDVDLSLSFSFFLLSFSLSIPHFFSLSIFYISQHLSLLIRCGYYSPFVRMINYLTKQLDQFLMKNENNICQISHFFLVNKKWFTLFKHIMDKCLFGKSS